MVGTEMCNEEVVMTTLNEVKTAIALVSNDVKHLTSVVGKTNDEKEKEISELKAEIKLLRSHVFGNGSPGLKDRVTENHLAITRITDWIDNQKKFQWIVISAILVEVVGILLVAFTKL